ncbi:MAG: hypothetical protein LC739_12700 [Actinobacteria bacterium]|nr:hypothetical protein [Actinomycetota bacterium]
MNRVRHLLRQYRQSSVHFGRKVHLLRQHLHRADLGSGGYQQVVDDRRHFADMISGRHR